MLETEISNLKEQLVQCNDELTNRNKNKLVCGEDFFAYVEFEMILKDFASKELEKFNRYRRTRC